MKLLIFLTGLLVFCFFGMQSAFAQGVSPRYVSPTLYCLGGIPCNGPVNETVGGNNYPTIPSSNTNSNSSDNNQVINGNNNQPLTNDPDTIDQPCISSQTTTQTLGSDPGSSSSGGFFKAFFEFILKLIELILQKLGALQPGNASSPDYKTSIPCTPASPTTPPSLVAQPTGVSNPIAAPAQKTGATNDVTAATCEGSANTPNAPVSGYKLNKCEDFNGSGIPSGWTAYSGGGGNTVVGKGRVASQCAVGNGVLTQTQNADGATCGMSSNFGQKYGYWEVKMKTYATGSGGSAPHPVLILWPDTNAWSDGELDYVETNVGKDGIEVYLHCVGNPSSNCYNSSHPIDIAEWHVYGFEWTDSGLKGFIDGQEIYATDGKGSNPKVSMHQTIQLDNLTNQMPATPAKMEVDWVHMYGK